MGKKRRPSVERRGRSLPRCPAPASDLSRAPGTAFVRRSRLFSPPGYTMYSEELVSPPALEPAQPNLASIPPPPPPETAAVENEDDSSAAASNDGARALEAGSVQNDSSAEKVEANPQIASSGGSLITSEDIIRVQEAISSHNSTRVRSTASRPEDTPFCSRLCNKLLKLFCCFFLPCVFILKRMGGCWCNGCYLFLKNVEWRGSKRQLNIFLSVTFLPISFGVLNGLRVDGMWDGLSREEAGIPLLLFSNIVMVGCLWLMIYDFDDALFDADDGIGKCTFYTHLTFLNVFVVMLNVWTHVCVLTDLIPSQKFMFVFFALGILAFGSCSFCIQMYRSRGSNILASLAVVSCFGCVLVSILTTQAILVACKLDGSLDTTWAIILIPSWVMDSALVCFDIWFLDTLFRRDADNSTTDLFSIKLVAVEWSLLFFAGLFSKISFCITGSNGLATVAPLVSVWTFFFVLRLLQAIFDIIRAILNCRINFVKRKQAAALAKKERTLRAIKHFHGSAESKSRELTVEAILRVISRQENKTMMPSNSANGLDLEETTDSRANSPGGKDPKSKVHQFDRYLYQIANCTSTGALKTRLRKLERLLRDNRALLCTKSNRDDVVMACSNLYERTTDTSIAMKQANEAYGRVLRQFALARMGGDGGPDIV